MSTKKPSMVKQPGKPAAKQPPAAPARLSTAKPTAKLPAAKPPAKPAARQPAAPAKQPTAKPAAKKPPAAPAKLPAAAPAPAAAPRLLPCDIEVRGGALLPQQARKRLPADSRVAVRLRGAGFGGPGAAYVLHVGDGQLVSVLFEGEGGRRLPPSGWLVLPAAGQVVCLPGPAALTRKALAELVGGREPDSPRTKPGKLVY